MIAVQFLTGTMLFTAVMLAPLFGRRLRHRANGLIWRARWLLCSMFLVYAWGLPGEALWNGLVAPTREGLGEGSLHLGRMILVLTTVAAFLEFMPLDDMVAAIRLLSRPFRPLGVNVDRGVVRLMLVLRYVETLPRPREWKSLLEIPEPYCNEIVEIEDGTLGGADGLIIGGLGAAGVLVFFW